MGSGSALPHARPQWRNQHHTRQPPVDEGSRMYAPPRRVRRQRPDAYHTARHERLRFARQRIGILRDGRYVAPTCSRHVGARKLQRQKPHLARVESLLRIPLNPHGSMGRPRHSAFQRRPIRRRYARPQRTATRSICHHQQRHHGDSLGNRSAPIRRRRGEKERPPAPRQNAHGRHGEQRGAL